MKKCRLIVVEGIPGAGKSTMAGFIHHWLDENDLPNHFYGEGNPEHPADFEGEAYFTRPEWDDFLLRHPFQQDWLAKRVEVRGDDHFLNYRKHGTIPEELLAELAQRDVYELASHETYRRLALERWQAFAEYARQADDAYVFECCLMQNPLVVLTLKHNRPIPETLAHIQTILDAVQALNPILIYLLQKDPRATFERVAAVRPKAWMDFFINYTERGAWGQATGKRGFDAVVDFHLLRQAADLELVSRLAIPTLVVDQSDLDWEKGQEVVAAFLGEIILGNRE
jgi:hypothetical protein